MARKKVDEAKIKVGNITDVSGKVTIAGRDIYEGYTAEQVSLLLKEITTNYLRQPFDGRCPYKGLDVFEEEDADLFFGRERLVEDLLNRVKESRTVFITGPSGSGKSSLVRAGLIHALKQGRIKGSERWLYETMKPGREPIKELSLAFSRLKGPDLTDYFLAHANETDVLNKCAESVLSGQKSQRFVLFIDQFEEVFTQINGEEERQAFINMLAHAGTVEDGRVIVLFAMRSDFVSNCATYPALNELLSQEFRQIGAMQPEELVSAIALPAKEVGLPIEDELIARIINDMKGEPGALPLMQFALKDLFDSQQAKGGVIALTLEDYLRHGGIQKSLERHADASLAALDEKSQNLARSIFSGLIEIGRGTQDTKRTALFDELVPANASTEEVLAIVQKLADARLIITDEQAGKDTVTISHEKLIEAWPWLKKLVGENRDVIALQNEVASDAKEWEDHQRDASYLYTGARLANVREQLDAKKLVLSGLAQEFIEIGVKAYTEELEAARQRTAQLRKRSIYLTSALVASLIAVGVAVFFGIQSQRQAKIARAGELTALSVEMREKDIQVSSLLGIEAFRSSDTIRSRGNLLDVTNTSPQLLQFFPSTSVISEIAISPNGKILASSDCAKINPDGFCIEGTIILWDLETHQQIGQLLRGHRGGIWSIAFSSDGKMLASSSCGNWDNRRTCRESQIILWDARTHQPIAQPITQETSSINSIAFSPDGKSLASGSDDHTIILWDVETRQPIGHPLTKHTTAVWSVAFSPNGKILASGSADGTIILWDVDTQQPIGRPLAGHTNSISSVIFSPDGKILASGSYDAKIILWDVKSQKVIGQPIIGTGNGVTGLAFSPDGKILASDGTYGNNEGAIIFWDVETQQMIDSPLRGYIGTVWRVAFNPDGKTIVASSDNLTISTWAVESRKPIGQPLAEFKKYIFSMAFSPDSKILATGTSDGTIILWDMETRQLIGQPLRDHTRAVEMVAFSPNGKILASAGCAEIDKNYACIEGQITLWDTETHQSLDSPITLNGHDVTAIAFSPDSKTLAFGSDDGTIILWDVKTRQPIDQPLIGYKYSVFSLAFSPDGKMLASGGCSEINKEHSCSNGESILWDMRTRQMIKQPLTKQYGGVVSVIFSRDGKTLASGSGNGTILLWDVETQQPIGQPFIAQTDGLSNIAFSPDGKILASSGGEDGTITLWDVQTRQPIGKPFVGHIDGVFSLAFSPDGNTLASSGSDSMITLWDVNPQYWVEQSCRRVGRNFTRTEWTQYFPIEEYRKTCDQWPLEPATTP